MWRHCGNIKTMILCKRRTSDIIYRKFSFYFLQSLFIINFVLSGCSLNDENNIVTKGDETEIQFSLYSRPKTKVTYQGYMSFFENGDRVGVFAFDQNNTIYAANKQWEYTDAQQTLIPVSLNSDKIYYRSNSKYSLYSPYDNSLNGTNCYEYSFSVNSNQESLERFQKSDLLWINSQDPTSYSILVDPFLHKMALIMITINKKLTSIQLQGMQCKVTIDITTGVVTTSTQHSSVKDISMCEVSSANGEYLYKAVVPSQDIDFVNPFIRFKIDGENKYRTYTLSSSDTGLTRFEPGEVYVFKLNKLSAGCEEIDENDWYESSFVWKAMYKGKQVGVLCREYLKKGTEIDAQALVFYKMKRVGNSYSETEADMTTGTVIKILFVYDGITDSNNKTLFRRSVYSGNGHGGTVVWNQYAGLTTNSQEWIDSYTPGNESISDMKQAYVSVATNGETVTNVEVEYGKVPDNNVALFANQKYTDNRGNETCVYNLVKIGYNQFWMSQNLRTTKYIGGSNITFTNIWSVISVNQAEYSWSRSSVYSGLYDDTYKSVYGALYSGTAANNPELPPSGFHIPDRNEINTLMHYLKDQQGVKLKTEKKATNLSFNGEWSNAYSPGTNITGFAATPSGCFQCFNQSYSEQGYCSYSYYKTGDPGNPLNILKIVYYFDSSVNLINNNDAFQNWGMDNTKRSAFTIRCLRTGYFQ